MMDNDISLLGGLTKSPTLRRQMVEKTRKMANRMGKENQTINGG
jgi:hypothetical protein